MVSYSPPFIPIPRYLSPINNSHLSYVSISTLSFHLPLGLPFDFFCVQWLVFLVYLAPSIRCRCPIHLRRCSLIKTPMMTSFYNFSSSTFLLICYRLLSSIGSKIFLYIFLSKVISVFSADLLMNHVSAQYVATGRTALLHSLRMVTLDIFLDSTTLIKLKLNLLPNTTQCLISLFMTLLYGIAYIYENLLKLTIKHTPKFVAQLKYLSKEQDTLRNWMFYHNTITDPQTTFQPRFAKENLCIFSSTTVNVNSEVRTMTMQILLTKLRYSVTLSLDRI